MNIREIIAKLESIEGMVSGDMPVEGYTSLAEGIWDSVKAWAGDEGAKARKAIEAGAKSMMARFKRFAGPYENSMRQNESRYFEVLRTFLLSLFPFPVIKEALVRTQKEIDISAFSQYMNKTGTAKSQLDQPAPEQTKSKNPFDVEDLMNGAEIAGLALMEMETIMEDVSNKQLMTLFIHLIIVSNEMNEKEPVWLQQEMTRNGGTDVLNTVKSLMDKKPRSSRSDNEMEKIVQTYAKITGEDEKELPKLVDRVSHSRSYGSISDKEDLKRLAQLGYSYIKVKGR